MSFNPKFGPGQSSITHRQGLNSTTYIKDTPTVQRTPKAVEEKPVEVPKKTTTKKTTKKKSNGGV